LRQDFTGIANSRGLLYDHEDAGTVGIAFLTIGEKAVPALSTLPGDERTHLRHQGSLEATVGNGYGYRIKDFAAYYIGKIIGISLKYYACLADGDARIGQLKKEIEQRKLNSRLSQ
jgi:hypothetical protein